MELLVLSDRREVGVVAFGGRNKGVERDLGRDAVLGKLGTNALADGVGAGFVADCGVSGCRVARSVWRGQARVEVAAGDSHRVPTQSTGGVSADSAHTSLADTHKSRKALWIRVLA